MSLLSQLDRQLAITAFEHYADFLKSEISFIEDSQLVDDPNYPEYHTYKQELYELNTLLNWVRLEHYKNENKPLVL
jgi:hypothetical protein